MTTQQLALLLYIRAGCNSFHGLAAALGKKPGNGVINWHLTQLKEQRLVTWQPDKSRTLQLTALGRRAIVNYCLIPDGVGYVEMVREAQ